MNHLAHFHLSFDEPGLVVGNWAGDVVKGNDWQQYPPDVQRGIRLHRTIDAFTDAHPATHKLSGQIRAFAGRYAGPVGDVLRDHFLSICWPEFSGQPLQGFANGVYNILTERNLDLPPVLQERTPRMIAANWLMGYEHLPELVFVLERLQRRIRNQALDIAGLCHFVEQKRDVLMADFRAFYPEITAAARAASQ